jgi:hypothetical protein
MRQLCRGGASGGDQHQPREVGIAGHNKLPGPNQRDDRGHRSRVRKDVGERRRCHVRLRPSLGRRVGTDTVRLATSRYRPGWVGAPRSGCFKAILGSPIGTGRHVVWPRSDGSDPKSAAGTVVITADILRRLSVVSDNVAITNEFTFRAVRHRNQQPELSQQGCGAAEDSDVDVLRTEPGSCWRRSVCRWFRSRTVDRDIVGTAALGNGGDDRSRHRGALEWLGPGAHPSGPRHRSAGSWTTFA